MGFTDFFRKRKKVVEEIKEPEKITFDDIENFIGSKRKEINDREKEIFVLIENKIALFVKEINEKINILENKSAGLKKPEDKLYLIAKENLSYYIIYVKRFIENINNLKEENLEELINKAHNFFLDFNKKTHIGYQKAILLAGDEIAAVREPINNLFKYLTKLFDENKEVVDSSKTIYSVEANLANFNEINNTITSIDERITVLDGRIKKVRETDKKVLNKIEESKKSDSYVENLKKQEELKLMEEELEKQIYKLKELIDFKALGNVFHVSEGRMGLVKAHKEDFQTNFQKDNGKNILSLLNEAKLNTEMISVKINQINDKKEKMIKNKGMIKKNETDDLLAKSSEIKLEINDLNDEKTRELKRCEKFETSQEEAINLIKEELIKLNVVVG